MRIKTFVAGCLIALLGVGAVFLLLSNRAADAQTPPPSSETRDCQYPIDCATMDYNPCCQATGCKEVLVDPGHCVEKTTLEAGTTTEQGVKSSILTTNHYHMLRAATCPSSFKLTSWGEARSLPLGSSSTVISTTTTGTIAATHLICPEMLPDNATITAVALYGYDNTSTGYMNACLYKSQDGSSGGTSLACATSTTIGEGTWVSSTISETVNNTSYTYYVSTYVTPGEDTNLKIYTVEVRYTTP